VEKVTDRLDIPLVVKTSSLIILDLLVASRPDLDISSSEVATLALKLAQNAGRWNIVGKLVAQGTHKDKIGRMLEDQNTLFHRCLSATPEIARYVIRSGANVVRQFVNDHENQEDSVLWLLPIHNVAGRGKTDVAHVLWNTVSADSARLVMVGCQFITQYTIETRRQLGIICSV
jgi:hypothetical protein